MYRRKIFGGTIAILAALSMALTGCTPPGQSGSEAIVVYSNSVGDGRGAWLTEQAKTAGFTLQIVDLGGGDVMNRLIAEKNNPLADVAFGLNNVYYEKLKAAGVLETYKPNWSEKVDATLGDSDGYFWPIVREPIMLVYNKAVYATPDQAPKDWPDLWKKPEFAKKYEVPTALGGATSQMVVSGILSRYQDPSGELGISAEGWKEVSEYFAKGSPAVTGTDLYARMAKGEVNLGQMWLAGKIAREKQYNISTDAVRPQVGVPMVVQHVSLVKGTKKAEQSKKFIDWFGSAEVQAGWSKKFGTAPTNKDAIPGASVEAVKMTDSFTAQKIDWAFVAKNIDSWVEKIQLNYLNK